MDLSEFDSDDLGRGRVTDGNATDKNGFADNDSRRIADIAIDYDGLVNALKSDDFEPYREAAAKARDVNRGRKITLRAIIEYSNVCKRLCRYCGLNARNANLKRYRMTDDEIVGAASKAVDAGYRSIVLQGGEDGYFNADRMASIIERIAKTGALITLSAGELSDDIYTHYYNSGARRYLLKHETANERIFAALHPDGDLNYRLGRLAALKRIGYDIGSGFMVGLPGQTVEDIADDIMLCRKIGADMAGIGTFIPHEDTELKSASTGSAALTLRAVALTRILLPKINIPSTTSLGVAGSDPYIALDYGADVIMRKVTPTEYRRLYQIYSAPSRVTDIAAERKEITEAIEKKGFTAE